MVSMQFVVFIVDLMYHGNGTTTTPITHTGVTYAPFCVWNSENVSKNKHTLLMQSQSARGAQNIIIEIGLRINMTNSCCVSWRNDVGYSESKMMIKFSLISDYILVISVLVLNGAKAIMIIWVMCRKNVLSTECNALGIIMVFPLSSSVLLPLS